MSSENGVEEKYFLLYSGNEQAETSLVPVKDGVVAFNQTLKLYVNMYFDITTNRFVEKKVNFF